MPFLDEIEAHLVTNAGLVVNMTLGVGGKTPIPGNIGQPGGPAFFVTVRETGGTAPARTQAGGTQRPTAQIAARAVSAPIARAALARAYAAFGGVQGLHNVIIGGTRYVSVAPRQEIADLGVDETGNRAMAAFNIAAEKEPS